MELNVAAIAPAVAPPAAQAAPPSEAEGFAEVLGCAQSGAPPGKESPPVKQAAGEEVAKIEPNAQSLNPDFLSAPNLRSTEISIASGNGSGAGSKSDEEGSDKAASTDPTPGRPLNEAVQVMAALISLPTVVIPSQLQATVLSTPSAVAAEPCQAISGQKGALKNVPQAAGFSVSLQVSNSTSEPAAGTSGPTGNAASIPDLTGISTQGTPQAQSAATPTIDIPVSATAKQESTGVPAPSTKTLPDSMISISSAVAPTSNPTVATVVSNPQVAAVAASGQEANVQQTPDETVASGSALKTAASKGGRKERAQVSGKVDSANRPSPSEAKDVEDLSTKLPTDTSSAGDEKGSGAAEKNQVDPGAQTPAFSDPPQAMVSSTKGPETGAADSAKAGQSLNRRDTELVVRQVADRIQLMAAARPKDGVTIHLQPERLGTITMTVRSMSGSVQAHISASDDNVRTALEQNRQLLGQSLDQRGLRLDSVSIVSQSQASSDMLSRQNQQQAMKQNTNPNMQAKQVQSHAGGSDTKTPHSTRSAVRSISGVDLWI